MKSRRGVSFLVIVGCLALIGEGLTGTARSTTQTSPVPLDSCVGRLDAWIHPHIVPGYLAWESAFASFERPDSTIFQALSVDATSKERIVAQAAFARSRAKAIRASAPSVLTLGGSIDPDTKPERGAAQAVIEARDELLRSLPDDVMERIVHAADDQARHLSFTLPAPGRLVTVDGMTKCRVTVNGREFPHLIPEADYWEFYFRVRSMVAAPFATSDGFAAEHIRAVRSAKELDIPEEYIQLVLRLATETTKAIDNRRAQRDATDSDIFGIVMKARTSLLRTLPGPVWLMVTRDAGRVRAGENFTFPSTY